MAQEKKKKGSCSLCENHHHLFLQVKKKKKAYFVVHKIFSFLAIKVYLPFSGCVYIKLEKWTVYVVCGENDKVDSGHFLKGRWKFMKDRSRPLQVQRGSQC